MRKKITSHLKLLKNEEVIGKAAYENIKPVGSKPGLLYRLGTMYKETKNGLPPFRPALSATGIPNYQLVKFLLPFLTPLTEYKYIVKDSFHFAEKISKQNPNLYMASSGVDSLFTNIPLIFVLIACLTIMIIPLPSQHIT